MSVKKYATREDALAAKRERERIRRLQAKEDCGFIASDAVESRAERASRQACARMCALPWRDSDGHVRGGAFAHRAIAHQRPARVTMDAITGDKIVHRGSGFYARFGR